MREIGYDFFSKFGPEKEIDFRFIQYITDFFLAKYGLNLTDFYFVPLPPQRYESDEEKVADWSANHGQRFLCFPDENTAKLWFDSEDRPIPRAFPDQSPEAPYWCISKKFLLERIKNEVKPAIDALDQFLLLDSYGIESIPDFYRNIALDRSAAQKALVIADYIREKIEEAPAWLKAKANNLRYEEEKIRSLAEDRLQNRGIVVLTKQFSINGRGYVDNQIVYKDPSNNVVTVSLEEAVSRKLVKLEFYLIVPIASSEFSIFSRVIPLVEKLILRHSTRESQRNDLAFSYDLDLT